MSLLFWIPLLPSLMFVGLDLWGSGLWSISLNKLLSWVGKELLLVFKHWRVLDWIVTQGSSVIWWGCSECGCSGLNWNKAVRVEADISGIWGVLWEASTDSIPSSLPSLTWVTFYAVLWVPGSGLWLPPCPTQSVLVAGRELAKSSLGLSGWMPSFSPVPIWIYSYCENLPYCAVRP